MNGDARGRVGGALWGCRGAWIVAGIAGVLGLGGGALGQMSNVCGDAPEAVLAAAVTVVTGDSTTATSDLDESSCSFLDDQDVWMKFTAPVSGAYTLSTLGSDFDTTLSVFSGCGGFELFCNDDEDFDNDVFTSLLSGVQLTEGTTYFVRVAGYFFDFGGVVLSIQRPETTPVTTACCDASGACTVVSAATCPAGQTPAAGGVCGASACASPSVVCCRGTTCAVVANSAECVVPPGATVGASVAGGASVCNAGSSTQTPCCYADFDKVGSNTIDDIFIYLNAWFANSPYAKVGGDGVAVPTIDDIFVFLNAWFAGC